MLRSPQTEDDTVKQRYLVKLVLRCGSDDANPRAERYDVCDAPRSAQYLIRVESVLNTNILLRLNETIKKVFTTIYATPSILLKSGG